MTFGEGVIFALNTKNKWVTRAKIYRNILKDVPPPPNFTEMGIKTQRYPRDICYIFYF